MQTRVNEELAAARGKIGRNIDREIDREVGHRDAPQPAAQLLARSFNASVLALVQITCRCASSLLLAAGFISAELQASALTWGWPADSPADAAGTHADRLPQRLIVIGFMGGNVQPNNFVHREARLTRMLQVEYPETIHAEIFANRRGQQAFDSVLRQIGNGSAQPTADQKQAARIVIFGHSWGASETVALANRLYRVGVPVLLTIQVDSVEKQSQNDARIPPNVQQAVNFYQADGMLRGRDQIVAADPGRTTILGNYESSYRNNPVSCAAFPWYARAFMKPHVQIENDPAVWNQIESLILAKLY